VKVPRGEDSAEAATGQTDSLSILEQALRRALGSSSREQVLQRVIASLPAESADTDQSGGTKRPRPGLHGKIEKVSVSMPAELTEAVRLRTGVGGFSRYVTDAVQARLRHDQLGEVLDELEAKYGEIPPEVRVQTRQLWPDEPR
jgi:hypothetical protein